MDFQFDEIVSAEPGEDIPGVLRLGFGLTLDRPDLQASDTIKVFIALPHDLDASIGDLRQQALARLPIVLREAAALLES